MIVVTYLAPAISDDDFWVRHASEQYLMASQFLAQDLRQVISLPQATHNLLGRKDLFPLNPVFSDLLIPNH
jgi:hypothetical protein